MGPAELTAIIEQALQTVLGVEDVELTESFDGKGIDVSGDDWTWHVEDELSVLWPSTTTPEMPPPTRRNREESHRAR